MTTDALEKFSLGDDLAEELLHKEPTIEWQVYIPDKQFGVMISLSESSHITGTLTILDDGTSEFKIDMITVAAAVQKRGIGTRLLELLLQEAQKYNADFLTGNVTSIAALKTRARLFGPENLIIWNTDQLKNRTSRVDQSIDELERLSTDGNCNFIVDAQLRGATF